MGVDIYLVIESTMKVAHVQYSDITNFFSAFGGTFSLLRLIFILLPTVYFAPDWFLGFIVDHLYNSEKKGEFGEHPNETEE